MATISSRQCLAALDLTEASFVAKAINGRFKASDATTVIDWINSDYKKRRSFDYQIESTKSVKTNLVRFMNKSKEWCPRSRTWSFKDDSHVIIDTPTKRRRVETVEQSDLDSTFESIGNDTFQSTFSITREEELEQELAIMKAKFEAAENRGAIFRYENKPRRTYNPALKAVLLDSVSRGHCARTVHEVLSSIATHFDLVKPELNESVPCESTIKGCRNMIDTVVEEQLMEMVSKAEWLTAGFDESSVDQKSCAALGLFDDKGEFLVLKVENTLGSTGDEIMEVMRRILFEETSEQLSILIRQKLRFLISDRCPAQERANDLLIALLKDDDLRAELPDVESIPCVMHGIAIMEKKFASVMSERTKQLQQLTRICLGYRQGSGNKPHSIALQFKALTHLKTPFISTVGCRYGDTFVNARAMLEHENEIRAVLKNTKKKLTDKQIELRDIMTSSDWKELRLEMSLCMIAWLHLINPLHKTASDPSSNYGLVKGIVELK